MNFRHTLYPAYKSNRPPTPDTIVQGRQYLKAAIKAMSIKVIEVSSLFHAAERIHYLVEHVKNHRLMITQRQVPGVEADDVIGTLAARSVDAGFKVNNFNLYWEKLEENGHIVGHFYFPLP